MSVARGSGQDCLWLGLQWNPMCRSCATLRYKQYIYIYILYIYRAYVADPIHDKMTVVDIDNMNNIYIYIVITGWQHYHWLSWSTTGPFLWSSLRPLHQLGCHHSRSSRQCTAGGYFTYILTAKQLPNTRAIIFLFSLQALARRSSMYVLWDMVFSQLGQSRRPSRRGLHWTAWWCWMSDWS